MKPTLISSPPRPAVPGQEKSRQATGGGERGRPALWLTGALVWLGILTVVLVGCSQRIKEPSPTNKDSALTEPPVETYAEPALKTEGSLFSDDSRMDLFADVKARRVGDIITINIVETSKANKSATTSTGRTNALTAQINHLMGYEDPNNIPGVGSVFNSAGLSNTGIEASYGQGFTGRGSTNRNENMTAKMSARIIQVLPNGNLVLRGSQEILVNNEKQYITVQGVVRPADIAADNSVLSTYMADARIDYTGEGDLSRKQREGWLSRFLDVVWPF